MHAGAVPDLEDRMMRSAGRWSPLAARTTSPTDTLIYPAAPARREWVEWSREKVVGHVRWEERVTGGDERRESKESKEDEMDRRGRAHTKTGRRDTNTFNLYWGKNTMPHPWSTAQNPSEPNCKLNKSTVRWRIWRIKWMQEHRGIWGWYPQLKLEKK